EKSWTNAVDTPPQFLISLRTWTPPGTSTLGDWGPRAERLDRSLDAYTPVPSTPSSMGALVQSETTVASGPSGLEWLPIFGRGFRLRCFRPLFSISWLPGSCLLVNWYTRGFDTPYIAY